MEEKDLKNKDNDNNEADKNINLKEIKNEENIKESTDDDNIDLESPDKNSIKLSDDKPLLEEIEILKDEKLRLLAEMDNVRKRADRDRSDLIKYGSFNLAREILSPDDNLKRALESIPNEEKNSETVNNLIDGLKMVQKEFASIMEKHGVKKINAINEKFDHNFHQAMIEIENNEVDPGTVIKEIQSGYTMHDRLLRPSMVGVSKKIEKNEEDGEEEEGEKD